MTATVKRRYRIAREFPVCRDRLPKRRTQAVVVSTIAAVFPARRDIPPSPMQQAAVAYNH